VKGQHVSKHSRRWRAGRSSLTLVVALGLVLTCAGPGVAQWAELERWLDGSQPLTFGLDTGRYRVTTFGAKSAIGAEDPSYDQMPYRLVDPDLHGTAISFDLKLRWPSASSAGTIGRVEPYLSFGPSLLLMGSDLGPRPAALAPQSDGAMALGLSWGAGISWRLSRNAELFGGYRFMQYGREGVLSPGERDADLIGHDVLYGISVRF
jgi:opacity protein-like surface antigen